MACSRRRVINVLLVIAVLIFVIDLIVVATW